MDSRRKDTQQMLGALLVDGVIVTAKMYSPEEQAMIDAIESAQGLSQHIKQCFIEAAPSKREDEAIESLSRTLAEAIRDKHRGFKCSIDVTRSST